MAAAMHGPLGPPSNSVADELASQVAVLRVNAQDGADNSQKFAADLCIISELARDPRGSNFSTVGGFGRPTTLLVDEDGFIRYRHAAPLDAERLRVLLETHLGVDPA